MKDPAVLFYIPDFLTGTALMSSAQVGNYIRLLCYQQQSSTGSLTLEDIQIVLGMDFEKNWPALIKKFKEDENGFFNARMRFETERRRKYSESRVKNRAGQNKKNEKTEEKVINEREEEGLDVSQHMLKHVSQQLPTQKDEKMFSMFTTDVGHMETETETVIEIEKEIETGKGMQGENQISETQKNFALARDLPLPGTALEAAERNQLTQYGDRHTDFIQDQWQVFLLERLNDPPERRRQFRQLNDLTKYFINWIREKKPLNGKKQLNGNHPGKASGVRRSAGKL